MKEHPILFSAPMVRAMLENRKTQTRRVVRSPRWSNPEKALVDFECPYGWTGDRLWVREAHVHLDQHVDGVKREDPTVIGYPADDSVYRFEPNPIRIRTDKLSDYGNFEVRPSMFMHRWASRIALEVVGVRVERVQEITEDDALAEGVFGDECSGIDQPLPVMCYEALWRTLNTAPSKRWEDNPWVWVLTFKRI